MKSKTKSGKSTHVRRKTVKFHAKNQRFIWIIGSIREVYPDIPDLPTNDLVLWDRQEHQAAAVIPQAYANIMCLEMTGHPARYPLQNLENWLNNTGLHRGILSSENIPDTK